MTKLPKKEVYYQVLFLKANLFLPLLFTDKEILRTYNCIFYLLNLFIFFVFF